MSSGKRKPSRKHVTTACTACREGKVKCDGARPRCGNCGSKNRDCVYQEGGDKRKVSLRRAIEVLSARNDLLERILGESGMRIPDMNEEDRELISDTLKTLQLQQQQQPVVGVKRDASTNSRRPDFRNQSSFDRGNAHSNLDHNPMNMRRGSENVDPRFQSQGQSQGLYTLGSSGDDIGGIPWTQHPSGADMGSVSPDIGGFGVTNGLLESNLHNAVLAADPVAANSHFPRTTSIEPPFDGDSESSDDENHDEVIDELSTRLGGLQVAEGGQLRFYGATSNLNLLHDEPVHGQLKSAPSLRQDGQKLLEQARVGQEVPRELEEHLIKLYFAWADPSVHVVDKEMFEQARENWKNGVDGSPYHSEVLTNAICALGASFECYRHPPLPDPLAEFFATRAKALMNIELESPCVATVQALVVLSSHELACTRDALGWLYSGMAMRLAFDLGLHLDMTQYVLKGKLSEAEAEVRRVAFWGCYIMDNLWSFYLGRPYHRVDAEDISVGKPTERSAKIGSWASYVSADLLPASQTDPLQLVTKEQIMLCEEMSDLGRVLFGRSNISNHALQARTQRTTDDLMAWYACVPPELQVNLDNTEIPCLPHILQLHMQYHGIQIFIHRPWTAKYKIQPFPPRGAGYAHARQTCIDSASAISKLLCIYKKHYTLRRINVQAVHIVFTAALIHISNTVAKRREDVNPELVAHLETCCDALAEMGQAFANATRALELLMAIKRKWQARLLATVGSKRRSSAYSKDRKTSTSTKRLRPASVTAYRNIGLTENYPIDTTNQHHQELYVPHDELPWPQELFGQDPFGFSIPGAFFADDFSPADVDIG